MSGSIQLPVRRGLFILFSVVVMTLSVLTQSCAIQQKQAVNENTAATREGQSHQYSQASTVEQRIIKEYRRWEGTRHELGGTDSKGIDCSGFVQAIYKNVFNINLPRTTNAQVRQGKFVSFKELQPGDLVFFKPPDYPRHVGIYLSEAKFAHASKTKGVIVSKIDALYWGKYYWTARRILPAGENP